MKKMAIILLATGIALTACGTPNSAPVADPQTNSAAGSSAQSRSASASARPTSKPSPTPSPTPSLKIYKLNEPADHDGLVIQISEARISPTLLRNTTQYRPDTDLARFEEVPAKAGASYLLLTTQVTNNTKKGLDLTCGGPVQIRVYNNKEQEYSPVDDLYEIKGNPTCNASLDPGFSAPMTWAFLVPTGSTMIAASFYNINDFSNVNREPTFVALDPNYR